MAVNVKKTSLCGLGQTAPNPVLTTIRYFRDEYEAHIDERRCPALSCEALIAYVDRPGRLHRLHALRQEVPGGRGAPATKKQPHVIDQELCIRCDACRAACKFDAVKIVSGPEEIAAAVARAAHLRRARSEAPRGRRCRSGVAGPSAFSARTPCPPARVARIVRCVTKQASSGATATRRWMTQRQS